MTESSPNVIEIKLDRLIDDMRFLRSQIIAFDRRLNERKRREARKCEGRKSHAELRPKLVALVRHCAASGRRMASDH
jgi:hypothetical protein